MVQSYGEQEGPLVVVGLDAIGAVGLRHFVCDCRMLLEDPEV